MSSPTLEELENDVQKLIEGILIDQNWASAFGSITSPDKGGYEGYFYITSKPEAGVHTMEDFLAMKGAVQKVLLQANTRNCAYNLERGGTIEFEFEE